MCNDHEYDRRVESEGVRCEMSLGCYDWQHFEKPLLGGASIYIVQPAATQHQTYQDTRQI